jgi:dTDP-D-glucose 4,6-dehydratase
MIRTIADKTVTVEYLDRRDIDNVRRRVLNVERIRRELRWTPSVTLERGLASTYRWLLEEKAQPMVERIAKRRLEVRPGARTRYGPSARIGRVAGDEL